MFAMLLDQPNSALQGQWIPIPEPHSHEVQIRVTACGVCRTDLHIIDGDLPLHKKPLILGHELVGTVVRLGESVTGLGIGQRVGVPWLGGSCGKCDFCRMHRENLCDHARFTGYDNDGGYAQYAIANADYCIPLPEQYDDVHAAPLLCAGLIGFRAYSMLEEDARRIGIYGFGAAAHIITQVARHCGREVYAYTRPGDTRSQGFAKKLGAVWAGDSDTSAPERLDAALIFASVGALVPHALSQLRKGGDVICAGIHMSDIPSFPYSLLWGERRIRSVANLTQADGKAFFDFVSRHPISTVVTPFSLCAANEAVGALRRGAFDGAAVLIPGA